MANKYFFDNVTLEISEEVYEHLHKYIQRDLIKPESGGLILGRTDIHGNSSIYKITTPMANDIRSRIGFRRLDKEHLRIVKIENNNCLYFKGNWHTHPQDIPIPSWTDIMSWQQAMRKSKPGNSKYIFFIIVGRTEMKIWCGDMQKIKISEMRKL